MLCSNAVCAKRDRWYLIRFLAIVNVCLCCFNAAVGYRIKSGKLTIFYSTLALKYNNASSSSHKIFIIDCLVN